MSPVSPPTDSSRAPLPRWARLGLAVVGLVALALAAGALAQTLAQTPAQTQPPAPPKPMPAEIVAPPSTPTFLAKVAAANQFEIDSSQLALEKSQNQVVRNFAQQMIAEHGQADAKLKQAIAEAKVTAPTAQPEAEHREALAKLKDQSGAAFDKLYIDAQYKAHVDTVSLFEAYAKDGDNPRLKQFAAELLPTLRGHLDHIGKMR